jgi:hypothetical protein
MAWTKTVGTKHSATCSMTFGRKDESCPRCQELLAGSKPRTWNVKPVEVYVPHVCTARCGVVCTWGEW